MHSKGMYKELVFYLEACESGSMFATLPSNMNIYATTAANGKESSWGTYCGQNATVDGKNIGSCLGDLFSVSWMEDSDLKTPGETIEAQFDKVKQEVALKSHAQEFGDKTIAAEPLTSFQGNQNSTTPRVAAIRAAPREDKGGDTMLDSRHIELTQTMRHFLETDSEEAGDELIRLVNERLEAGRRFRAISKEVTGAELVSGVMPEPGAHITCHHAGHKAYVAKCGEWSVGALKYSATLLKLCAHQSGDVSRIIAGITKVCAKRS